MIRLTGMSSGLDTETMITELMKGYTSNKDKKSGNVTKHSWKMEKWEGLNKKIKSFYSKSLSNMRFSTSYTSKKTTVSDPTKATVTASSSAVTGTQTLAVKQMAQAGYLTGGVLEKTDKSKVTADTTLADLGYAGGTTSITVKGGENGSDTTVSIDGSTKLSDIMTKISAAGVNANLDTTNQRIFISSKSSGKAGDFELIGDDANATAALTKLGLYTGVQSGSTEYEKYSEWAGYDTTKNADGTYADSKTQAAYQAELDKRVESYKSAIVSAKDAITEANKTKTEKQTDLDAAKSKLTGNTQYAAAEATANDLLTKISNGTITADEKTKYGLSDMSDEDLKKVKADTLIDTALKVQSNDLAKQIESADDATKATLEAQKKDADDAIAAHSDKVTAQSAIDAADETITKNNTTISEASQYVTVDGAGIGDPTTALKSAVAGYIDSKVQNAKDVISGAAGAGSSSAVRVYGQDAQIYLNGAYFESSSNSFDINGLNITVSGLTGLTEDGKKKAAADLTASDYNTIQLSTDTDVDGIYKSIKNFLKEYNELIKEMETSYNAASAKDYSMLTDDEKDAMSDKEVETWETKIKDSLLRRDSELGTLISTMKNAMSSSYTVNGENYSLASYGIETLSYFLAGDNERGMYHIDGDADDEETSGNDDKLKAAIAKDPEAVSDFFIKLSSNLYSELQKKSTSSSSRSFGSFYSDKTMKTQYEKYKTELSDYEEKIADIEDKYYKQFSSMETALSKLESSTSSLTSLFGS